MRRCRHRPGLPAPRDAAPRLAGAVLAAALAIAAAGRPSLAADPPRRVVSLDLCTDWMLVHDAPRDRVAALSPLNRRYPVAWLDDSWPVHDGTLEGVLALQPDLVVTGQYNARQLRERLRSLGVRVEVLALPTRLDQLAGQGAQLRSWLGLAPPAAVPPVPPVPAGDAGRARPRLLLLGANGVGTGRETFEDDILTRAGWRNYLQASGYQRLDLEQVAADPPDAILWSAPDSPALANRYAEHPVLRRAVPAERWLRTDYWRWQCPGPWTWALVRELREALRQWQG